MGARQGPRPAITPDGYLTAQEAARRLGLCYDALLNRVKSGRIRALRDGRIVLIHQNELARYRESCAQPQPSRRRGPKVRTSAGA